MGKKGENPTQSRYRIVGKPPYINSRAWKYLSFLGILRKQNQKKDFFMEKKIKIILPFALGILFIIFVVGFIGFSIQNKSSAASKTTNVLINKSQDYFAYKGNTGKDALSLLKEKADVKQDSSGLVISINGRATKSAKKEYWAFFVNGKMAEVGPADYKTNSQDLIEWRVKTY